MTAQQQVLLLQRASWLPSLLRRIHLISRQVLDFGRPELLIRRPVFTVREAQVAFLEALLEIDRAGRLPTCYFRGLQVHPSGRLEETAP
jgi:hypothetical protein